MSHWLTPTQLSGVLSVIFGSSIHVPSAGSKRSAVSRHCEQGSGSKRFSLVLATLQADIMSCQCLQDQPGSSPPVLLSESMSGGPRPPPPARCGAPLISVSSENGSAQSTCGNSLRARAARPLGLGVQDAFPPAHPTVVWVQVWA